MQYNKVNTLSKRAELNSSTSTMNITDSRQVSTIIKHVDDKYVIYYKNYIGNYVKVEINDRRLFKVRYFV